MRTRLLLRNVHHRATITPVSSVRTSLIRISPSSWTIFRSFESILEWEMSVGLEDKFNVLCKSIASEKHSI